MTVNQRIKILRKTLGLNQTDFAGKIGITQTSLSQIESEKNGISYDVYKAIVREFDVTHAWLTDGDGEMFRTVGSKIGAAPIVVTVNEIGDENIIFVDRKAAAGYLQGLQDRHYLEKLPAFRLPGYTDRSYRAFEVSGDSMLPTIWPNDVLICSYVEELAHIRDNYVHIVVTTDGSIVTKRAMFQPGGDPHLLLRSDNTVYPPYAVPAVEVAQVWRVQGRLTTQLTAPGSENEHKVKDLESRMLKLESLLRKEE